jgi:hypothetical protein
MAILEQQFDFDRRVTVEEFAQYRRKPHGSK